MEEVKERMWQQFMKTGDPSYYMMYKALGGDINEFKDN